MKKKILIPIASAVVILSLCATTLLTKTGASTYTLSPADAVSNSCASCHSPSGAAPTVTLTFNPALGTGNTYTPNATYTITITATGRTNYGFDFEILNSTSATATAVLTFGTFGAVPAGEKLWPATPTTGWKHAYSDITHSTPSSSGVFTVIWTAPASGTGHLYCSVLGGNGGLNDTGDNYAAKSMTLAPSTLGVENIAFDEQIRLSISPNPASEKIHTAYFLPESAQVSIKLFGLNGELITEMINEKQNAGQQIVDTNLPEGIAKGIYFVKVNINGNEISKKIVVN